MRRRTLIAASLSALTPLAAAQEPPGDASCAQDFDELWRTLGERYCYFADKATDWNAVRAHYRPTALAAQSIDDFTETVRQVLAELYDAHTHLSDPPNGSPRWPLYDLLVGRQGAQIRIHAIEPGSAAADADLRIDDAIVAVNGSPIDAAMPALMPKCLTRPDPAAEIYALNVAVAGRRGSGRVLDILQAGKGRARRVNLPEKHRPDAPDLHFKRLPGDTGAITIRSFANTDTIAAFDHALAALQNTKGLIIDVRDNGGGDTAVARPIMGRFINQRRAYALMRRREGAGLSAPWTEYVEPRGPFTYTRPVIVLTSPWSASMAEGFPMGMRDIGRARIMGTRMMGLGAATYRITLDRTGIAAQYSGEPVYDTHDAPRAQFQPDILLPAGVDAMAIAVAELSK